MWIALSEAIQSYKRVNKLNNIDIRMQFGENFPSKRNRKISMNGKNGKESFEEIYHNLSMFFRQFPRTSFPINYIDTHQEVMKREIWIFKKKETFAYCYFN